MYNYSVNYVYVGHKASFTSYKIFYSIKLKKEVINVISTTLTTNQIT